MADPRHALGLRAEEAAIAWLERSGWRVVARRWRAPAGELDVVALDPEGVLVGIEVRCRRSGRAGRAEESVDRRHVARLRAALGQFAGSHAAPHVGVRLDLITATPMGTLQPAAERWHLARLPAIDAW